MMQMIIGEGLYDAEFVAAHTLGFNELVGHVPQFTPEWAARETGIAAERIAAFARAYATTKSLTQNRIGCIAILIRGRCS
jgi:anaerobic selenocysteine-containing dehydrogenase